MLIKKINLLFHYFMLHYLKISIIIYFIKTVILSHSINCIFYKIRNFKKKYIFKIFEENIININFINIYIFILIKGLWIFFHESKCK